MRRLQEASDLASFKELVGGEGDEIDLNTFEPKNAKDFETLASTLVSK